jgi:hypothetical protein
MEQILCGGLSEKKKGDLNPRREKKVLRMYIDILLVSFV